MTRDCHENLSASWFILLLVSAIKTKIYLFPLSQLVANIMSYNIVYSLLCCIILWWMHLEYEVLSTIVGR